MALDRLDVGPGTDHESALGTVLAQVTSRAPCRSGLVIVGYGLCHRTGHRSPTQFNLSSACHFLITGIWSKHHVLDCSPRSKAHPSLLSSGKGGVMYLRSFYAESTSVVPSSRDCPRPTSHCCQYAVDDSATRSIDLFQLGSHAKGIEAKCLMYQVLCGHYAPCTLGIPVVAGVVAAIVLART